jgi:hypothetical protein
LLGNLSKDEIATRLGVDEGVVEIAEALFFDIGAVRHATGWMNCHVFIPEVRAGDMELAAKMKLAFYGGPVMARALLGAEEHLPLDEAQQLVDQETMLHSKLQAALEFELDPSSAAEFLKNYLEYDLARRKLDFERQKFEHACELARERRKGDEVRQADVAHSEMSSEDPVDGGGNLGLAGAESKKRAKLVA